MIRVLLVGGGSGGHIYPLLAVAGEFAKMDGVSAHLSYIGPKSPFTREFLERDIAVYRIASSKIRRYFSLGNFIDIPKFFWSVIQALYKLYILMPDVVFSKGGPGSLAVVIAARFYFIPVFVHESDAVPGLTNHISGKLAQRVAVSFPETKKFFSNKKTAYTGNPIRGELLEEMLDRFHAKRKMNFDPERPLILFLGGSQGAEQLNEFVIENLLSLLEFSQVLHQTGVKNYESVSAITRSILGNDQFFSPKYLAAPLFEWDRYKDALCAADIVISRSGSVIAEIAAFGKPSILVPLETSANDHQRANAYSYAATGAAEVFEGKNFTYNVVVLKIKEILEDEGLYARMSDAAKRFSRPDAARVIADEIVKLSMLGQ